MSNRPRRLLIRLLLVFLAVILATGLAVFASNIGPIIPQ